MSAPASFLAFDRVSAAYGPFRAVFDVTFEVPRAGAVALLGPNGAGKTTIARVISGLVAPASGRVRFDGVEISGLAPWRIARMGIAHAPEGRSVFASLTVEENLTLAFQRIGGRAGAARAVEEACERFPALAARRRQSAGTLSGGEQRMLSLARVLVAPPRLLVVDELSLGLAPTIVDQVFRTLSAIRDGGTSLVVVEQHADRALALCDVAVILRKGRVVYRGPAAEAGRAYDHLSGGGD